MAGDGAAGFPAPSDLDWGTAFAPGEWEELGSYYRRGTGQETMDGIGFLPMMHGLRPSALKRYRLAIDAGRQRLGDLPDAARALSSLFDHVLLGYHKGILYDLRGSRQRGARRSDVGHLLSIAWMYGGNQGVHAAADAAGEELRRWSAETAETAEPPLSWPLGWSNEEEAWSCGIDWSTQSTRGASLSAQDVDRIVAWHERVEGAVPAFVPFLARHHPLGLLTYRARYEATMHGRLPKQFVSLLLISLATRQEALVRSLRMAKVFGVGRDHVLWMLTRPRVLAVGLGTRSDIDLDQVAAVIDSWD
jgi:hypothetical protein